MCIIYEARGRSCLPTQLHFFNLARVFSIFIKNLILKRPYNFLKWKSVDLNRASGHNRLLCLPVKTAHVTSPVNHIPPSSWALSSHVNTETQFSVENVPVRFFLKLHYLILFLRENFSPIIIDKAKI